MTGLLLAMLPILLLGVVVLAAVAYAHERRVRARLAPLVQPVAGAPLVNRLRRAVGGWLARLEARVQSRLAAHPPGRLARGVDRLGRAVRAADARLASWTGRWDADGAEVLDLREVPAAPGRPGRPPAD